MTREELEAVMTRVPRLTAWGIAPPNLNPEDFETSRILLRLSGDVCGRIVAWLADKVPSVRARDRHGAYHLKHIYEEQAGEYVTEGQFIAAAVHADFPFDIHGRTVEFGISAKSLKAKPAASPA